MMMMAGRSPGVVAVTAFPLGLVCGLHICLAGYAMLSARVLLAEWSLFVIALCAFHCLEFAWSATFEPDTVTANAFLLNHSRAYHVTLACAVVEFLAGACFFPEWKAQWVVPVAVVGFFLVVAGQAVRTAGMWTAGKNFTHLVAEQKREGHALVRSGLYATLRHPAYFGVWDCVKKGGGACLVVAGAIHASSAGWFYWTIGMQLLLVNPLSLVLWTLVSMIMASRCQSIMPVIMHPCVHLSCLSPPAPALAGGVEVFLRSCVPVTIAIHSCHVGWLHPLPPPAGIPYEEAFLVDFFGVSYIEYAQHTWIGIPFIQPYAALVGFRSSAAITRLSSSLPSEAAPPGPPAPVLRRQ